MIYPSRRRGRTALTTHLCVRCAPLWARGASRRRPEPAQRAEDPNESDRYCLLARVPATRRVARVTS
eukprot:16430836-Heterocapsa_arctica.AAC.1